MEQVVADTAKPENSPVVASRPPYRWRVEDDHQIHAPDAAMARDIAIAQAVAHGATPTFRIWQSGPALAVSRQDLQLANITNALVQMNDAGWPVVARGTGGTAVPLSPGVLNISMVLPRSLLVNLPGYSLDTVYRLLCAPIQRALAGMHITTAFGSVPGAFCDGRFNLVSAGKKIAGTAQVWRANVAAPGPKREGYVLAHAALFVDVDPYVLTETVNRFYSLAGKAARYSDADLTSVRLAIAKHRGANAAIGRRALMDTVRNRIVSAISDVFLPGN